MKKKIVTTPKPVRKIMRKDWFKKLEISKQISNSPTSLRYKLNQSTSKLALLTKKKRVFLYKTVKRARL